jgi:hypothetical protein
MTLNYNKVWDTMNSLKMVTSKVCSAREILNSAIDALENHNLEKAETLMYAADEFLQYYLADFDVKFKDAWKETVVKIKQPEQESLNEDWEEFYYPEESKNTYDEVVKEGYEMTADGFWIPSQPSQKEDKVIRWRLPIEEVKDGDTDEIEYFITLPDDLLEAANLSRGEEVEWHDQGDGAFILKKTSKTYDEMLSDGYTMTDDGVWIRGVCIKDDAG